MNSVINQEAQRFPRGRGSGAGGGDAVVPNVWTQPETFRQGGHVYGFELKEE